MHTRVLVPEEVAENVNIWPSYLKLRRGHLTEDRKEEKTILHTFLHNANTEFLCTIELEKKKIPKSKTSNTNKYWVENYHSSSYIGLHIH